MAGMMDHALALQMSVESRIGFDASSTKKSMIGPMSML
jgi:hypothetical protein